MLIRRKIFIKFALDKRRSAGKYKTCSKTKRMIRFLVLHANDRKQILSRAKISWGGQRNRGSIGQERLRFNGKRGRQSAIYIIPRTSKICVILLLNALSAKVSNIVFSKAKNWGEEGYGGKLLPHTPVKQ